jgi:hypothetical protein
MTSIYIVPPHTQRSTARTSTQQADQLKNDSIRFWLPHHRPVPQLQLAMNGVKLATHFSSRYAKDLP